MATALIPITELTLSDVQSTVRALLDGGSTEAIADYVASVDWSYPWDALPEVKALLGLVESLATEYGEGDIDREEYFASLREAVGLAPPP